MTFNKELLKKDMHTAFPVVVVVVLIIVLSNAVFGKICALRMLAGIPCPGCGLTRAFLLIVQGDIRTATEMHPFWIPIVFVLVSFAVGRYFIENKEKRRKIFYIIRLLAILTLIGMFVLYVYRMVNYYPDVEPMVYDKDNILNMVKDFWYKIWKR